MAGNLTFPETMVRTRSLEKTGPDVPKMPFLSDQSGWCESTAWSWPKIVKDRRHFQGIPS